jgi:hypothetical protein
MIMALIFLPNRNTSKEGYYHETIFHIFEFVFAWGVPMVGTLYR